MQPQASAALVRERDYDRYLAALYAPSDRRGALLALFALDLEMLQVASTTREPMIGQIRLAWWRERLEALDTAPPPAQPTLTAISNEVLPKGVNGASLAALEDGFLELIGDELIDVARYADMRGGTLFEAAATVLGGASPAARAAGRLWAAARLPADPRVDFGAARATVDEALAGLRAARGGVPPVLLGLAALARRDLDRAEPERPGAPARQARLLWSILSRRV